MWQYSIILAIFSIFYLIVPGLGAFYTRSRWRRFRASMADSSLLSRVSYRSLAQREDGFLGFFRFFGSLEAIQGDDTIWLRNGSITISADLANVDVYMLPSFSHSENEGIVERNEEALPDEMPQRIPWDRVFNLPEGTQVFLSGPLYARHGQGVFRHTDTHELTVVFYDGDPKSILRRAIWGARQRNEYWNQFTPWSLLAGTLTLLFLAYNYFSAGFTAPAIISIAFCTTPMLPFLPPGVLFYLAYRGLWKRSRYCRAERDILRLPMRYFGYSTSSEAAKSFLPDGGTYDVKKYASQDAALRSMKEQKVRTSSLLRAEAVPSYYVFQPDGSPSADPMAEPLLIPGDPLLLTRRCIRFARRFEVTAIICFACGYLANLLGVLYALTRWV